MNKILHLYNEFEEKILVFSLVINVLLIFSQIIMRSIFNYSISWSEELSRYIFIWQVWLGTSIAFKYDQHIRVKLIFNFCSTEKQKKILEIIVSVIWIAFVIFLIVSGFILCKSIASRNALSSGLRLPLVFVYVVLPISSTFIAIRIILDTINKINSIPLSLENKDDKEV